MMVLALLLVFFLLMIVAAAIQPDTRFLREGFAGNESLVPLAKDAERPLARANLRREIPAEPQSAPRPYSLRWRVGVGVPDADPLYFRWPAPRPGWFLNWQVGHQAVDASTGQNRFQMDAPAASGLGMTFSPMVRIREGRPSPDQPALRVLAARHPGRIWLIGNEPDVRWQDNVTPEEYAWAYHQAYSAIKSVDADAQIAIAGLSQITPLRLAYLERVWDSYQEQFGQQMPVDIWNMHAFVLREDAEDWGVGVPPGFEGLTHGLLWDVEDHDDLVLVENQVRLMRTWMAQHGQRQKPLYISEYGILMPPEFGFPPARVIRFLVGSFDLFRTLRDPTLGYSADDDRLVQRWVWFSTRYDLYPAGNLFTDAGEPTPVMRSMSGYLRSYADEEPGK